MRQVAARTAMVLMFTFLTSLLGCEPTIVQNMAQPKPGIYGPRWNDYEGWGRLELGMTKSDVLQALGEPFMTQQGRFQNGTGVQTLLFKVKPKHYPLQDRVKPVKIRSKDAVDFTEPDFVLREKKPEKFAETNVWGEAMNLFCVFSNGKLTEWYCSEIMKMDRRLHLDSLEFKRVEVPASNQ